MFSSWGIYEGSSNIGCNSRNLQFLFQEVANVIPSGGETPAFQRNFYCDVASVSRKGFLNKR